MERWMFEQLSTSANDQSIPVGLPMKILYASHRPPYPFFLGGAARCAHRLLLSLAQDHGISVMAVGSADYAVTPWSQPLASEHEALGVRGVMAAATDTEPAALDCGYPVQVLGNFMPALAQLIDTLQPNVVWSQLEGAQDVLALAHARGIPGVLYVHDAEDAPAQLRAVAALGCHVVCGSAFLADKVSRVIGRPAHVVHPASDWYFGTQGDPDGAVTMVNAHAVKGLATFLEVARRLPSQRFLLQESWKLGEAALAQLADQLATLPNVSFQRRVADMRSVYAQTRLLLVPSTWEEGFGMVAVEAQSCGIPVIASARGGLPESVGSGGLLVHDYRNADAWVSLVERVLGDPGHWQQLSAQALAHASEAKFSPKAQAQRFVDVCTAPLPRPRWATRATHWIARRLGT
jgi:glycosyltransferase involved in cell wall biosynthesis